MCQFLIEIPGLADVSVVLVCNARVTFSLIGHRTSIVS